MNSNWPLPININAWLKEDFVPEYLVDSEWNILITYQIWQNSGICNPSSKIEWVAINDNYKELIISWYQFIWETDENWETPEYLQIFLDSWVFEDIKEIEHNWVRLFMWKLIDKYSHKGNKLIKRFSNIIDWIIKK